jgi:hypothetical protein
MVLRPGRPELCITEDDEEAGRKLISQQQQQQQQQQDEADQAAAAAAQACKARLVSSTRYAMFNILYAVGIWILVPLTGACTRRVPLLVDIRATFETQASMHAVHCCWCRTCCCPRERCSLFVAQIQCLAAHLHCLAFRAALQTPCL